MLPALVNLFLIEHRNGLMSNPTERILRIKFVDLIDASIFLCTFSSSSISLKKKNPYVESFHGKHKIQRCQYVGLKPVLRGNKKLDYPLDN